jgi:hypothetical protein
VPREPVFVTPAAINVQTPPEPPRKVVSADPVSRHTKLLTNHDRMTTLILWDCMPGSFRWHNAKDETVFVISGGLSFPGRMAKNGGSRPQTWDFSRWVIRAHGESHSLSGKWRPRMKMSGCRWHGASKFGTRCWRFPDWRKKLRRPDVGGRLRVQCGSYL